jgi:hypothetical protein
MNGNLSFGILPNGQQFVQTVGLNCNHLLPQQQSFIPVQNGIQPFNLNNGPFPVHNFQQGMTIDMASQQMPTSNHLMMDVLKQIEAYFRKFYLNPLNLISFFFQLIQKCVRQANRFLNWTPRILTILRS